MDEDGMTEERRRKNKGGGNSRVKNAVASAESAVACVEWGTSSVFTTHAAECSEDRFARPQIYTASSHTTLDATAVVNGSRWSTVEAMLLVDLEMLVPFSASWMRTITT